MIDVAFGATLIAEGTQAKPIIFTSLRDTRFGAGGTFATSLGDDAPKRGDWSGVALAPTSLGSLDYVHMAYGGGTAAVNGNFIGVNVLEVNQADARIAHSVFEENFEGVIEANTGDRFGRGFNEPATIFVRGAQPIVFDNLFINNEAAAININVNALNHFNVIDVAAPPAAST